MSAELCQSEPDHQFPESEPVTSELIWLPGAPPLSFHRVIEREVQRVKKSLWRTIVAHLYGPPRCSTGVYHGRCPLTPEDSEGNGLPVRCSLAMVLPEAP